MRAVVDALLSVVIAAPCAACGRTLEQPSLGPVCRACWNSILPITPPLCDACGDPLPTWRTVSQALVRCARCRRAAPAVDRARAVGTYDGVLRAIVHALKYEARRSLAGPLGALMRVHGAGLVFGAAAAVPVPLHPARRRERGFNQAADLAAHLGIGVVAALRRVRPTVAQASLPAARRHRNVRGAFVATPAARTLRGLTVLLVDDVSTTGATLEACARTLKDEGISEVRALVAARVPSARSGDATVLAKPRFDRGKDIRSDGLF